MRPSIPVQEPITQSVTKIQLPEKMLFIGGLPRASKTLLRNIIGSHKDITVPPSEYQFFVYFSETVYRERGSYENNLKFFFENCRKSTAWKLSPDRVRLNGEDRRDLYYVLLETYRQTYFPHKKFVADNTPFLEQHFGQLVEWFGLPRIRFLQIFRDPYDNYASITYRTRQKKYLTNGNFVHEFCRTWAQSTTMGLYNASVYPASYKMVNYDTFVTNPREKTEEICDWLGVERNTDRMLQMVDYQQKQSSSFVGERRENTIGFVQQVHVDRREFLSDYERKVIEAMYVPNLLGLLQLETRPVGMGWKAIQQKEPLDQNNLLQGALMNMRSSLSRSSPMKILGTTLKFNLTVLSLLVRRLWDKIRKRK